MGTHDGGTWLERTGIRLRGVLQYLDEYGGTARKRDILAWVAPLLEPDERERGTRSNGQAVWENDLLWQTTNLVKAGWLTKDGWGTWSITPAGVDALRRFPDPAAFHVEATRLFNRWNREEKERARQRAWLLRGSSVLGVNLVPEWVEKGFCSLSGSHLQRIETGVTVEGLKDRALRDYAHLKHQALKDKVEEIVSFVDTMTAGDLVVTSSDGMIYVGDITGDWTYEASDGGRSNLRRPVEWRNADAPIDYAELPAPLPAAFQSGDTVVDLTDHLALIDALGAGPSLRQDGAEETPPELRRHERLASPSQDLADSLFVDHSWLVETADLLDERRQLIFYGPPGTGKTFIARRLAADLVGTEQVKLVQFHPAYTYEDFFEGYRPIAGSSDGTIGFELRPGPFRRLVARAVEHPDQAFVLIIDEINRANLAKVFGELYFLLEYRDEAVDLLYSSDERGFTLPPNLYIIGTMNTADRSIALLDSAMRRRFAFVELSPDAPPTRTLLRRWSRHHGLGDTAADLLDALNARIEDPDFRIGPSYFMRGTDADAHSRERLRRIWDTSILPLLQEHHYGEWDRVEGHYRLESLLPSTATDAFEPEADTPAADE